MKTKKIVLMGLACSGKTTMLRVVTEGKIPTKEWTFHATIDYERKAQVFNDTEITFYDTGGVSAFLDRFTGELSETIFSGTNCFVFVVDSIEIKDISRAKYYFDLSLKKIEQYCPDASVIVFQHKTDLVPKKMREEVYDTIKDYLLMGINRNVSYYETSLFNTSFVIAMCAVYQATLGYIPNNWLEQAQNTIQ